MPHQHSNSPQTAAGSIATASQAAAALNCPATRIAKTLAFMVLARPLLVVLRGDCRVDLRQALPHPHAWAPLCSRTAWHHPTRLPQRSAVPRGCRRQRLAVQGLRYIGAGRRSAGSCLDTLSYQGWGQQLVCHVSSTFTLLALRLTRDCRACRCQLRICWSSVLMDLFVATVLV